MVEEGKMWTDLEKLSSREQSNVRDNILEKNVHKIFKCLGTIMQRRNLCRSFIKTNLQEDLTISGEDSLR